MPRNALIRSLTGLFRFQAFWSQQTQRIEQMLGGFALGALDTDERAALTSALYDARGDYKLEELFEWEEAWFEVDLPKPSTKILVGGAGSGREVKHLLAQGYQVVAFDPAHSFVLHARKNLANDDLLGFFTGGYEDLLGGEKDSGRTFRSEIKGQAPYDAILLGWGSLTHTSTPQARLELLRQLKKLCPSGPVLASFWMMGDDSQRYRSRAWRIGWRAGRLLTRQGQPEVDEASGDEFSMRSGYGHFFTLPELTELASWAGYQITRSPKGAYAGVFPHMTLRPLGSS